jgi:hypothetical protein
MITVELPLTWMPTIAELGTLTKPMSTKPMSTLSNKLSKGKHMFSKKPSRGVGVFLECVRAGPEFDAYRENKCTKKIDCLDDISYNGKKYILSTTMKDPTLPIWIGARDPHLIMLLRKAYPRCKDLSVYQSLPSLIRPAYIKIYSSLVWEEWSVIKKFAKHMDQPFMIISYLTYLMTTLVIFKSQRFRVSTRKFIDDLLTEFPNLVSTLLALTQKIDEYD